MNCRAVEPLLFADRDGALSPGRRAALEMHVAACPACRLLRERLVGAVEVFRSDVAGAAIPDFDTEWRAVRARLPGRTDRPARKRPLAPVIWFGASLAAAAAIAVALLSPRSKPVEVFAPDDEIAQAEFVEPGDASASTMVYVDKESGWLVVWAADGDASGKG